MSEPAPSQGSAPSAAGSSTAGSDQHVGRAALAVVVVACLVGAVAFGATRWWGEERSDATGQLADEISAGVARRDAATIRVPTLAPIATGDEPGAAAWFGGGGDGEAVAGEEGADPQRSAAVPVGTGRLSPHVSFVDVPAPTEVPPAPLLVERFDLPGPREPTEPGSASPPGAPIELAVDPAGLAHHDGDAGAPGPRFTDPCTVGGPGDEPPDEVLGEACPDDGEPATVLGSFPVTAAPPMWVVGWPYPPLASPHQGFVTQCPATEYPDGAVPFGVTTANPAVSTLRWWSERDPTVRSQELVSTEEDRQRWEAWVAGGQPYRPSFELAQHCTHLEGLELGDVVHYDVEAVDDFGQISLASDVMAATSFTVREVVDGSLTPTGPRLPPPTRLVPLSDSELLVITPVRAGQRIEVRSHRRDGAGGADPCLTPGSEARIESFAPARIAALSTHNPIPDERRASADYAWDPTYAAMAWGAVRLDAGAEHRVCVLELRQEGATFEQGAERVLAYDISTPDARSFLLTLRELRTREQIPAGGLSIVARPVSRGLLLAPTCGGWGWRNDRPIPRDVSDHDVALCTPPRSQLHDFHRGVVLDVTFDDPRHGPVTTSHRIVPQVRCDLGCAALESEWFALELPTVQRPAGLCSPGLFESDCEPPTADRVLGSALLELTYGAGGADGRAGWDISAEQDLGDRRPRSAVPLLDLGSTVTTAGPTEAPDARISLLADRPVQVLATVRPADPELDEPCLSGDVTGTASSTEPARRHELSIEGLCPFTAYGVELTLTDADGATSTWGLRGTPGVRPWPGAHVVTPGFQLAVGARIEIGPLPGPGDGGLVQEASVFVSGSYVHWLNELTGCHPDWRGINGSARTEAGSTLHVVVRVRAHGVRTSFGCPPVHEYTGEYWAGGLTSIRAAIPLADALAVDEVVVGSTPEDPIPVRVVLRVRRTS